MTRIGTWFAASAAASCGFGCSHEMDGPAPSATALEPALVCNEQITTAVAIDGSGLSPVPLDVLGSPRVGLPWLDLLLVGDLAGGPVADPGDPVTLPDAEDPPRVRWTSRTRMTFDVFPALGLRTGIHSLTITNRNGKQYTLDPALVAVPRPTLESIGPDIACVESGDRTLTLSGGGFLRVGGDLPAVAAADADGNVREFAADSVDDCAPVAGPVAGVERCATLTFTIPQDGLPVTGDYTNYDIRVTNPAPASCYTTESVTLTIVPSPTVAAVDPQVTCNADHDSVITLSGSGFLEIDGTLPAVSVGATAFGADSVDGCSAVTGPSETVRTCTTLTFTVPEGTLAPGTYDVAVTNPAPAGCTSESVATLTIVPPPEATAIVPDLVCLAEGARSFIVDGSGFIDSGGTLPTISVDGATFPADSAGGCAAVPGAPAGVQTCTSVTFTIPADGVASGSYEVVVTNPPPIGCASAGGLVLVVAPPPEITGFEPPIACETAVPSEITLVGTGFLVVDGTYPSVTVDATPVTPSAAGDCTAIAGIVETAETCTRLTIPFPAAAATPGTHSIALTNPPPAGCSTAAPASFDVARPPEVTGVVPARVCSVDFTVTVTGTGFLPGTQVALDGTAAASTTYVSGTEIRAEFPAMPAGTYDLAVSNGPGCEAIVPAAVTVVANPVVFFVDPPVVYNDINLQVTIYVSGVVGTVTSVTITPSAGGAPVSLVHTFDPARPNRILATIPSGTAAGPWDVTVTTDLGCSATLSGGLTITDTLTLALESIDPPFGWTGGSTAVRLTAAATPPAGEVNFSPTPRAYLNPTAAGALATPLRSVVFVDPTRLTAVVPAGLAAGDYDVVAVNPDGTVGLLAGAFSVGTQPPPVIDEITPASVVNTGPQAVTANGADFRTPTVTIECVDPGGGSSTLTGTVTGSTATSVDFTIPAGGLADGTICVVRITNADGTYADYSAVSVTNPAGNLQPFDLGTPMATARRAPASVAGRATRVSRYVYAIGGDDGTAAGAMASAEAAQVDVYGAMGPWAALSYDLPSPRTLAGVAILGRYVYLAGGNDGTGAVTEVLRARILDPEDTPEMTDLDLLRGDGTGLDGGTWHYRVSAVMPAGDPDNPGGETLPSDPMAVLVPSLPEKVHLTVFWVGIPGATAYRIYRTAAADDPAGTEALLGEVPSGGGLSYSDTGGTVGAERPLRLGDLGRWAVMAPLAVAREGPGAAIAADPAAADTYHLYVVGGRNGGGAIRTYEYATIAVAADGSQTLGAWTEDATNRLPLGRWQLGAFAVDRSEASRVSAGTTYIYAVAGVDAGGATIRDTDAAIVTTGGTLGPWQALARMTPGRAGFGAAAANNRLYVFGGQGATPSTTTASAEICMVGLPGCGGGPPELVNWNALGIALNRDRYLMGSAVESAFIFLVGGASTGGVPTADTETTVW